MRAAGLSGGGKDKSTDLASLTKPPQGVLEVARRLLCGKTASRAAAKRSGTGTYLSVQHRVQVRMCVSVSRPTPVS